MEIYHVLIERNSSHLIFFQLHLLFQLFQGFLESTADSMFNQTTQFLMFSEIKEQNAIYALISFGICLMQRLSSSYSKTLASSINGGKIINTVAYTRRCWYSS